MIRKIRDEFDRERDFVVFRGPIVLGGKTLTRGQPFDKTKVTTRRLRQLYEQHIIHMSNGVVHHPPLSPLSSLEELTQLVDTTPKKPKIERVKTSIPRVSVKTEPQ